MPNVRLHVHALRQGGELSAELLAAHTDAKRAEIWFCGPRGLAQKLQDGLRRLGQQKVRFHHEAFEMR